MRRTLPLSIREVTDIEIVEPLGEETEDLWGIVPAATREPEEVMRADWDGR